MSIEQINLKYLKIHTVDHTVKILVFYLHLLSPKCSPGNVKQVIILLFPFLESGSNQGYRYFAVDANDVIFYFLSYGGKTPG